MFQSQLISDLKELKLVIWPEAREKTHFFQRAPRHRSRINRDQLQLGGRPRPQGQRRAQGLGGAREDVMHKIVKVS